MRPNIRVRIDSLAQHLLVIAIIALSILQFVSGIATCFCFLASNSGLDVGASAVYPFPHKNDKNEVLTLSARFFLVLPATTRSDIVQVYEVNIEISTQTSLPTLRYCPRESFFTDVHWHYSWDTRSYITSMFISTWYDPRLKWTPAEFNGTDFLQLPADKIWLPNIHVINNVRERGGRLGLDTELNNQLITTSSIGKSTWPINTISVTTCDVDVGKFPFDKQNCELLLQSTVSVTRANVILICSDPVETPSDIDDGEWILKGADCSVRNETLYGANYSTAAVSIRLSRRSYYYVVNFVVPCFAFSVINLVAFLVRADSGERVGVSISILLGIVVYQMIINEKLPETSESMSVLGVYIEFIMVNAILSTILFVLIAFLHRKEPRLPSAVRRLLCVHFVRLMCVKREAQDDTQLGGCKSDRQNVAHDAIVPTTVMRLASSPTTPKTGDELLGEMLSVLQRIEANGKNQSQEAAASDDSGQNGSELSSEWSLGIRAIDRLCFVICLALCIISNLYLLLNWMYSRLSN